MGLSIVLVKHASRLRIYPTAATDVPLFNALACGLCGSYAQGGVQMSPFWEGVCWTLGTQLFLMAILVCLLARWGKDCPPDQDR